MRRKKYDPAEYQRNKEKYLEYQRRYRNNPIRREIYLRKAREKSKLWYANNKEKRYIYNKLWWQKHIQKLENKVGRKRPLNCEICGKERVIVFDHNHKTGEFRGWICDRCNTVLGKVDDSVELLNLLIQYLNKNVGNKKVE
jgi:hypothetical protein